MIGIGSAATHEHASLAGCRSVPLDRSVVGAADRIVVVTDHASVDYSLVAEAARLVVDTRNVMAPFTAGMGSRLAHA